MRRTTIHKSKDRQSSTAGQLTMLSLAMTAALTAMMPTVSEAQIVFSQNTIGMIPWTSSDITVNQGVSISNFYNVIWSPSWSTVGTLLNNGMINSGTSAAVNGSSRTSIGAVTNNGYISGYWGVQIIGSLGSLTNSAGATIDGSDSPVYNEGVISSISNSGTITGGNLYNNGNGSITALTNNAGGLIQGSTAGVNNRGTIDSITNSGTIRGNNVAFSAPGIRNSALLSVLQNNSGGIISSTNGDGVSNMGSISSLSNSGTISGSRYGIFSGSSSTSDISAVRINTLTNSGVITGGTYAIYNDATSTIGPINNSGTIAGIIRNDASSALTINGGTGSVFGTLTGSGSGSFSGVGANNIGSISSASNLVFGTGNQLLNDHINVGSNTVTNSAGVLQVNNQLNITGNYVQNANGTLKIGVADNAVTSTGTTSDNGYGRLTVTGSAFVASGSTISLAKIATYNFAAGQRFVVIVANTNGTNYHASALNYVLTGFKVTGESVIDGSNTNLVLKLGSNSATNNASNANSAAALQGLFNYTGANTALLDVFNPAVALTNAGDANKAGAQLSPAATTNAVVSASSAAFGAVQTSAGARLDGVRVAQGGGAPGSGVATGESSLAPAVWGRLFGGLANQSQRDGISGYHASYGGLMLGSDVQVHSDWRVGGLFSYARTSVGNEGDNTGSSASVNSVGLTAYAGYTANPWYLNLTAGLARQSYSTTRAISYTGFSGTANGSFNGTLYTTTAEAGYPLAIGDAVLTPLAGLRYSTLRQDGYTETGGNGAALTVGGSTSSSLKSEIGAKFERSIASAYGEFKPFVRLGWNHEFRSTPLTTVASFAADSSGTTSFTAQGASPLRNTAALSLGTTLLQGKNLSLSARYTLEGARGYTAQTGDLTARWQY